jgi:hypothetical protein
MAYREHCTRWSCTRCKRITVTNDVVSGAVLPDKWIEIGGPSFGTIVLCAACVEKFERFLRIQKP